MTSDGIALIVLIWTYDGHTTLGPTGISRIERRLGHHKNLESEFSRA
jgi:hypothetical protein